MSIHLTLFEWFTSGAIPFIVLCFCLIRFNIVKLNMIMLLLLPVSSYFGFIAGFVAIFIGVVICIDKLYSSGTFNKWNEQLSEIGDKHVGKN